MEQTDKKLVARILLLLSVIFIGFSVTQFSASPVLSSLKEGRPFVFTILSNPPAVIKYYPRYGKAEMAVLSRKIELKGTDTQKVTQLENLFSKQNENHTSGKFFALQTSAEKMCQDGKNYITSWRKNPIYAYRYLKGYFSARRNGKCNLSFSELIALTLKLGELKPSDVLIAFDQQGDDEYLFSQLKKAPHPVLVKISNASDIKGLARRATDYLRFLSSRGILNVDVIGYGNWGSNLSESKIEAAGGKFLELSKLAKEIGLVSTEIIYSSEKIPFVDATLILAGDVKLPETDDWKAKEMIH